MLFIEKNRASFMGDPFIHSTIKYEETSALKKGSQAPLRVGAACRGCNSRRRVDEHGHGYVGLPQ